MSEKVSELFKKLLKVSLLEDAICAAFDALQTWVCDFFNEHVKTKHGEINAHLDTIDARLSALEAHDHSELVGSINALVERVKIIDKNVEEDSERFKYVREFLFCGKCHGSGSIWTGQRIETCPDCEGKAYINVADLLKRVKAVEEWQENHSPVSPFTDDKNPAPQKREWIRSTDAVWVQWADGRINMTSLGILADADTHDLVAITPVLDPNEPAPEGPESK